MSEACLFIDMLWCAEQDQAMAGENMRLLLETVRRPWQTVVALGPLPSL